MVAEKKSSEPSSRTPVAPPVASPTEPLLLTIPMVAAFLNHTIWGVRELIWSKKLPAVKLGKRLLVSRQTLTEFVRQLEKDAAA